MLTTDKQSQDLNQIAGVQDLSYENAAAVSGGVAVLFDRPNLQGRRRVLRRTFRNLGNFNNRASSIRIRGNHLWSFWTGQNFRGVRVNLGEGGFNLGGVLNNNIESARRIR